MLIFGIVQTTEVLFRYSRMNPVDTGDFFSSGSVLFGLYFTSHPVPPMGQSFIV